MRQYPDSYYVASLNKNKVSFPAFNGENDCDLCVIGGGFTGLSTAIEAATSATTLDKFDASGTDRKSIEPNSAARDMRSSFASCSATASTLSVFEIREGVLAYARTKTFALTDAKKRKYSFGAVVRVQMSAT